MIYILTYYEKICNKYFYPDLYDFIVYGNNIILFYISLNIHTT